MVDDGGANRQLPADHRGGRCRHPGFLQLDRDARIHPVGLFRPVAETDHVQLHRRRQLQLGRRGDAALEVTRQLAGPLNRGAYRRRAVDLQREPGLQSTKAARKIGPEIARPE